MRGAANTDEPASSTDRSADITRTHRGNHMRDKLNNDLATNKQEAYKWNMVSDLPSNYKKSSPNNVNISTDTQILGLLQKREENRNAFFKKKVNIKNPKVSYSAGYTGPNLTPNQPSDERPELKHEFGNITAGNISLINKTEDDTKPMVTSQPILPFNWSTQPTRTTRYFTSSPQIDIEPDKNKTGTKQAKRNIQQGSFATLNQHQSSSTAEHHSRVQETTGHDFTITYWFFFPYNRGKAVCTSNIWLLGRIAKPLFQGGCLGQNIVMGNHVGDWEHVSIFFQVS